jgi:hypothetical protein
MREGNKISIVVTEPNWVPLERVLLEEELPDYMYMGRAGDIELYKNRWTRRYLNLGADGRFYLYSEGSYLEVTQSAALEHVHRK